jgi:hypothetical protein
MMVLSAEGRAASKQQLTPEDVQDLQKEREKRMAEEHTGYILGYTFPFWRKFVVDGQLDRERLLTTGYTEEQIPDIERQMREGGLFDEGTSEG